MDEPTITRAARLWSGVLMSALLAGCGGGSSGTTTAAVPVLAAAATPTPTPTPTPTSALATACTPTSGGVIVQSGDSIGLGYGANWAAIDHLGFCGVTIRNVSTSGEGLQTGLGRDHTDLFPFYDPKQVSILVLQQGSNDLGPGSAFAGDYLYGVLTTFVQQGQAAGFYVVAETVLPRQDANWTPAMEQQRLAYNKLVRANTARADAINDVAADPVIGDGSNPATSPYYGDALHPTLLGQQRLAAIDAAALAPLLSRPPRAPTG